MLLSSHALAELDRVADYLVVLSGGGVRLDGETDDLLACHRMLTGPVAEADSYAAQFHVVQDRRAGAQAHLLVRTPEPEAGLGRPGWEAHQVGLAELVLAYLRAPGAVPPSPSRTDPAGESAHGPGTHGRSREGPPRPGRSRWPAAATSRSRPRPGSGPGACPGPRGGATVATVPVAGRAEGRAPDR